jgi:hypothetical protein
MLIEFCFLVGSRKSVNNRRINTMAFTILGNTVSKILLMFIAHRYDIMVVFQKSPLDS